MNTPFASAGVAIGFILLWLAHALAAEQADDWIRRIRKDHPRLFFNADQWPAIKQRALTVCKDHLAKVMEHANSPARGPEWSTIKRPAPRPGTTTEVRDWGDHLMSAAFVYRINPDAKRLKKIKEMLQASLDYYHACYAENKAVDWYSRSRIGWLCAMDWVWDKLTPQERQELGEGMIQHMDDILHKPNIQRRNRGGHTTGYYGENNLEFFVGVLFHNEGINDRKALEFLKGGYAMYQKLFAHRSQMMGDDGGAASPTLGYSFGEYPTTEWNFLYTWQAATGEDISARWSYIPMITNYMMWNLLPGGPGKPALEFGYGDTPHIDNLFPRWWPYTHLSHIMHFYGRSQPEWAALAAYLRQKFTPYYHHQYWSVYPFLMTNLEKAPPPMEVRKLPPARHFENMGQIFMRSGDGDEDTYALFACGGITAQHKHYDALHFTIYKMGFLALDTGTRAGNTDNLQNYFAQTVAHNCILIKMPGEPPSPYWNGPVYGQAGGQNKQVGSKVIAFETGPLFTYVAGDATPVYNEQKCKLMVRQFVFVPPNHFVVFDRATSTKAAYKKTWLLHHANEPIIDGKTWRSDQDRGRIFCRTLLPEDAVLEKVGGPGKEFLVDGVNYPINQGPAKSIVERGYSESFTKPLTYKEVPELMGRWRMEVCPGTARAEDIFLHLIQVSDKNLEKMCDARVTTASGWAELTFTAEDKQVTLRFATTGQAAGHICIAKSGQVLVDKNLTKEVMPQKGIAIAE